MKKILYEVLKKQLEGIKAFLRKELELITYLILFLWLIVITLGNEYRYILVGLSFLVLFFVDYLRRLDKYMRYDSHMDFPLPDKKYVKISDIETLYVKNEDMEEFLQFQKEIQEYLENIGYNYEKEVDKEEKT